MTINSLTTVFYTCIFLLPGFIIKNVLDVLIPPSRFNETKYLFSCLLYSIINFAIWSWAYSWLSSFAEKSPTVYLFSILTVTIIGSSLIAFFIGVIRQTGFVEFIFSKTKIRKVHPIPSAWDYLFARQEESWVIVTLKSGRTIYGKYTTGSFASSDCEERDLFLEKTYTPNGDMPWKEDEKSNGILISKDSIEVIEFF